MSLLLAYFVSICIAADPAQDKRLTRLSEVTWVFSVMTTDPLLADWPNAWSGGAAEKVAGTTISAPPGQSIERSSAAATLSHMSFRLEQRARPRQADAAFGQPS